eukprot:TRINITY_DN23308_c0_g1_i1.p2 TRINITY_DN23308_c0_g1~~TRINITY_DN23308_c0_g1_i1.p2  ORF type:complete len:249 (-),score=42.57 TRINITY_DN23308_c0_g1_i1:220-966(-)
MRGGRRWFGCDVGVLECSMVPYGLDETLGGAKGSSSSSSAATTAASSGGGGCISAGCAPPSEQHICCLPDDENGLFMPCSVCGLEPACIVEVPCGHVNSCARCAAKATGGLCVRCRRGIEAKVDISDFLEPKTGMPQRCNMCKRGRAHLVMLPCGHMCFCRDCLPASLAGCPSCGSEIERMCVVQWAGGRGSMQPSTERTIGCFPTAHVPPAIQVPKYLDDVSQEADAAMSRLDQHLGELMRRGHRRW